MKKFLLVLAVFFLAVSCSDDSKSTASKPVAKITTSWVNAGDIVYNLAYDSHNRISMISQTGGFANGYEFTYGAGDRIESVNYSFGSQSKLLVFNYAENGKLDSFDFNGNHPLTYNPETEAYTFQYGGINHVVSFNDAGDFSKYNTLSFAYDTSKTGLLKGNHSFYHFLNIVLNGDFIFFMTHKPISGSSSNAVTYIHYNTYNDDGTISEAVINQNGETYMVIDYDY